MNSEDRKRTQQTLQIWQESLNLPDRIAAEGLDVTQDSYERFMAGNPVPDAVEKKLFEFAYDTEYDLRQLNPYNQEKLHSLTKTPEREMAHFKSLSGEDQVRYTLGRVAQGYQLSFGQLAEDFQVPEQQIEDFYRGKPIPKKEFEQIRDMLVYYGREKREMEQEILHANRPLFDKADF
ncbi:MAG TPA: hypothetical protein VNX88_12935 [Terriglobales bacterium]|jgi:hypothetical protein|nr:hypothetical protein [Terriglobales bacterium]